MEGLSSTGLPRLVLSCPGPIWEVSSWTKSLFLHCLLVRPKEPGGTSPSRQGWPGDVESHFAGSCTLECFGKCANPQVQGRRRAAGPGLIRPWINAKEGYVKEDFKTRQGSPDDRRPSTAEAPPVGKNHPFRKTAITLKPVMHFGCFSRFWISEKFLQKCLFFY